MKAISAEVIAVERQGGQYRVAVRARPKMMLFTDAKGALRHAAMKRRQEAEPINEVIIRKTIGMKPTPIMLWDLTELIGRQRPDKK